MQLRAILLAQRRNSRGPYNGWINKGDIRPAVAASSSINGIGHMKECHHHCVLVTHSAVHCYILSIVRLVELIMHGLILTLPMTRLMHKEAKNFKNHLNPGVLVFI